ncbi:MAG: hypothetical protein JW909_01855 [Planctomycetes bacterium]|nr:hypothetical protein [Planctomycetota bacterium]
MTGRERIAAVFEGREPDRPPVMHISFSSRVASRILGREAYVGGGIQQWREAAALWCGADAHAEFLEKTRRDALDIALACGHDMVRPSYWRDRRRPAERIDEHTFRYEEEDGAWEVKRLDPATELYNTVESSPREQKTLETLEREVEKAEAAAEAYRPAEGDFGDISFMLENAGDMAIRSPGPWTSIPVDEAAWLEAALLAPELVGRLLDAQAKESVKNVRVLAGMGMKYFFGGGDFASNHGPMYSPGVFHELMLPRLQEISRACREAGGYHLFGTDGNVWAVAEDMYGASGIAAHYEFDRRAGMNPVEVHGKYPELVMIGNISSYTLHTGKPGDVEREVKECIDEARLTNKVVTGCSNIVISETPPENVDAMLNAIAKHA